MELLKSTIGFLYGFPVLNITCVYVILIIPVFFYWKQGKSRWRKILKKSVDYHIYHLASINKDSSVNETSRKLAQALLWGATKQLPLDLAEGKGGRALRRSFFGDKTSLNICGTVYYQCAMNIRSIDKVIIKLNDTLLSTLYRIYILESFFSPAAVLYMDLTFLYYLLSKPETGAGRLFMEIRA